MAWEWRVFFRSDAVSRKVVDAFSSLPSLGAPEKARTDAYYYIPNATVGLKDRGLAKRIEMKTRSKVRPKSGAELWKKSIVKEGRLDELLRHFKQDPDNIPIINIYKERRKNVFSALAGTKTYKVELEVASIRIYMPGEALVAERDSTQVWETFCVEGTKENLNLFLTTAVWQCFQEAIKDCPVSRVLVGGYPAFLQHLVGSAYPKGLPPEVGTKALQETKDAQDGSPGEVAASEGPKGRVHKLFKRSKTEGNAQFTRTVARAEHVAATGTNRNQLAGSGGGGTGSGGRTLFKVAQFAVIVCIHPKTHQILMVKETKNRGWWLPAGGVEAGESPFDAAVRETIEEGGIKPEVKGILRTEYSLSGRDRARMRVVYYAEPAPEYLDKPPKQVADDESVEARWMPFEEVQALGSARQLRGSEPLEWLRYLRAGGPVYPLGVFSEELTPVPSGEEASKGRRVLKHPSEEKESKSEESPDALDTEPAKRKVKRMKKKGKRKPSRHESNGNGQTSSANSNHATSPEDLTV